MHRALVFVDSHVAAARPELLREIENYFAAHTEADRSRDSRRASCPAARRSRTTSRSSRASCG